MNDQPTRMYYLDLDNAELVFRIKLARNIIQEWRSQYRLSVRRFGLHHKKYA